MTPQAALKKQIDCYRRMTGEQRLNIADVWRDVVEGKIRPKST